MAVSGGDLWVADREGEAVIKFDAEASRCSTTVEVGDNPKGVAVAGNVVYVANTDSGNVSVIGIESDEEIDGSPIEVGGQPRAIDVLGDHVWVSNGDEASLRARRQEGLGHRDQLLHPRDRREAQGRRLARGPRRRRRPGLGRDRPRAGIARAITP